MKQFKLSKLKTFGTLCMLVMGSTFASIPVNATPLEDTIKGVDVSGMVRLKFYNEDADNNASDRAEAYNRYRSNVDLKFTVPVDDSIKVVYKLEVESNAYSNGNTAVNGTVLKKGSGTVTENQIFLQYYKKDLNVIAGRIPVETSITTANHREYDESVGSGAIATYNVGNGFTIAGAFIDDLENNSALKNIGPNNKDYSDGIGADVIALSTTYTTDMVNAQIWYYNISNLLNYVVTTSIDVKPVDKVKIHGEYAFSKVDDAASQNIGFNKNDTKQFYNINAEYEVNKFTILGGYAGTNKHDGIIYVNKDSQFASTMPVANNYSVANQTDINAWYGKVGYDGIENTSIYVAYANVDQGTVLNTTANDNDYEDFTVGASYKYNKKLSFSAYYDVYSYNRKVAAANTLDKDNNEIRLEAKYTF